MICIEVHSVMHLKYTRHRRLYQWQVNTYDNILIAFFLKKVIENRELSQNNVFLLSVLKKWSSQVRVNLLKNISLAREPKPKLDSWRRKSVSNSKIDFGHEKCAPKPTQSLFQMHYLVKTYGLTFLHFATVLT